MICQVAERQRAEHLEFEEDAAPIVFARYGDILYQGIWGTLSSRVKMWFSSPTDATESTATLVQFQSASEDASRIQKFKFVYSDKLTVIREFNEVAFFKSFYNDSEVRCKLLYPRKWKRHVSPRGRLIKH